jgi:hypothetical protein
VNPGVHLVRAATPESRRYRQTPGATPAPQLQALPRDGGPPPRQLTRKSHQVVTTIGWVCRTHVMYEAGREAVTCSEAECAADPWNRVTGAPVEGR